MESVEDYLERLATGPAAFYADLYDFAVGNALCLKEVYPPADDTFVMVEVILRDFFGNSSGVARVHPSAPLRDAVEPHHMEKMSDEDLDDMLKPATTFRVLEVGSGSGLISGALLRHLLSTSSEQQEQLRTEEELEALFRNDQVLHPSQYVAREEPQEDDGEEGCVLQEGFKPIVKFDSRQQLHLEDEQKALEVAEALKKRLWTYSQRRRGNIEFYATDKNPVAVECTRLTFESEMRRHQHLPQAKAVSCQVMQACFADCRELQERKFDLVIFNPPYVVTEDPAELQGEGISISWAGGKDGREVIDVFLAKVDDVLSADGKLYMCGVHQNDPLGVIQHAQKFGLIGELIYVADCGWEELWVIAFTFGGRGSST